MGELCKYYDSNITLTSADSVNCDSQADQLDRLTINAIVYREPAERGTNTSFSCPEGFLLFGSSARTCMGNGESEPDYQQTECKGELVWEYKIKSNSAAWIPGLIISRA